MPSDLSGLFRRHHAVALAGVPDGLEGLVIGELARSGGGANGPLALAVVARDGGRMSALADGLRFFAPDAHLLTFPAWDCLPYDRVSPHAAVVAERMATLAALARPERLPERTILLTTVNATAQFVPARSLVARQSLAAAPGNRVPMGDLVAWLEDNGFVRTATVREAGEYAVRGGILDLFAPGAQAPVRLDYFGDTLESIRSFDPESQRSSGRLDRLDLVPVSEVTLADAAISRFRQNYVARFGVPERGDGLYEAVSEGRRYPGLEHWLPLFHERLDSLFDYVGKAPVVLDSLAEEALAERLAQVQDHYEARLKAASGGPGGSAPYRPIEPAELFLTREAWRCAIGTRASARLSSFLTPETTGAAIVEIGGRRGRSFASERAAPDVNVFDAVVSHLGEIRSKKRTLVAAWSEGSRDRLGQILADHGLKRAQTVANWAAALTLPTGVIGLAVLGLEAGIETDDLAVIAEQDILGDRLVRRRRRARHAADVLAEASTLSEGDLIVHVDYGIGRFRGLKTIATQGAPHDYFELEYADGATLYLPVENAELLTRYGSDEAEAALDRLGGAAWQSRKARMKNRIREIADSLIKTAAARALRSAPVVTPPEGLYDEFAARFPYDETDDQLAAIEAVFEDLSSGKPMDRLICGDVGFGKTEVALRAAFLVAMSGRQVAVVVPTTLLARQHFKTFSERFQGLPLKVAQASRLVPVADMKRVKEGLADGTVDIVIGTHALLAKNIKFRDLGLLVIDEEQHFGVKHKERLKELKADIHVLTLTATPIPRTLQLALTGVRELSIIATPPVDRLAVRTFVSPFDPLVIREALLRERYRGGQTFYVVPRIVDLAETRSFLDETVPEAKVAVAHGQMPAGELEDIMTAFYEGRHDVLLSTSIVESGLDIPTANTLVVHRADRFGLAQLYQLRGRVGRSKLRAYALFTVPADIKITPSAERRLKVLQSLDSLGAGFQLASHDLDIRGAGNLLGEEQSGHIKEVGYELYQQMLEEAVASLKAGGDVETEEQWSPQISIGTPVLIPEDYVPDLQLRLSLYRRLSELQEVREIEAFGAEMVDRFGPLPPEVEHLLKIVVIKSLCRRANVEKVDAGPKGMVVAFRGNRFADPAALVRWISEQGALAKARPDQKIVLSRDWPDPEKRLQGTAVVLAQLVRLAEEGRRQAA